MSLSAIIPVKSLNQGKSRLSSVISASVRCDLNKLLFTSTLRNIKEIEEISHIFVISSDPNVLQISEKSGAKPIFEKDQLDINNALYFASEIAKSFNTNQVLILPTDLPLLTVSHYLLQALS